MLSQDDNELLTRVGPGTAMGELFRRFWLPAVLSEEVKERDSVPVRLRILCEDLLAFRDSAGRVGVVEAYCAHRGAPLFFGRNEDCGVRCAYHGWKFDVDGQCVDVPNDARVKDNPRVRAALGITAYPTHEAGGVVWVYMGPKERMPPRPDFEWTRVPESQSHASRWLQNSNWLQGAEGEIDSSHISFLHQELDPNDSALGVTGADLAGADGAPLITVKDTEYGFSSIARRRRGDNYFWRVSQWLAPMFSLIPRAPAQTFNGSGGRAWVPIDDTHTTTFAYSFRIDGPLSADERALIAGGAHFPPRTKRMVVQLGQGQPIDAFVPEANIGNDYLIDRQMQKTVNFTGIWGVNQQDRSVQEGMRPAPTGPRGIVDRSREHLMGSDIAIVTARRKLLAMARDLQKGIEPIAASSAGRATARAISSLSSTSSADDYLTEYAKPIENEET
ncbi:Rieske 2Fe-2S domain-containing protein [Piscinibacter koreensis]|uniref:Rieske 2Fe-2S domain-containing protein n=1 Tax=Piscinibacter koreensis TaxID=2742824 RepID=A0A7Y6NQZ1_9BURK|nr:Rieske 2Fe-2S domain-containing protein [Schlegelella koreensis]NUZ07693.1 Rieske 2Fe-2S domain-containing protein [Schlegelella koreensis]